MGRLLNQSWSHLAAELRGIAGRATLPALVMLSIALLVLGKADVKLASYVADNLSDLATPALAILDKPVAAIRGGADQLGLLLAVHEENGRLREENRRLLAWQAEAARLSVQNRALKDLLNVPAVDRAPAWTAARVVADAASPFVHTLLIDAGSERGVRKGMAVVTPEGLAGRVIDAGRESARVLLVTDFNSKIPVVVERSQDHAILEGDNSQEAALRFLPVTPGLHEGDLVMTSADGGLLPPGLLVGRISRVDGGKVAVTPFVDWARLDYVSVLRYDRLQAPESQMLEAPTADALPRRGPA